MGITYADGWPVVTVTPGDIVPVFEPAYSWVITVIEPAQLVVFTFKLNPVRVYLPIYAILAPACMDLHIPGCVIAPKNPRETIFIRHHRTVEDAVGTRDCCPGDDRVFC